MSFKKNKILLVIIFILAVCLRLFKLTSVPPSLYWEEVALGYDAYSLLKTGNDHRGNPWPIAFINSYMDYKPPLYVYAAIPSVAVFGLNEFGIRFPSALVGSLTVLVVYFLTKELFRRSNYSLPIRKYLPIVASLLLAISPWSLQFSRAAWEINLAMFLTTTAIWLFLASFRKKYLLLISAMLFSLALYTYHGARIFVPLMGVVLFLVYFKNLIKKEMIYTTILSTILMIVLTTPLLKSFGKIEIKQRFQETSAFTTLEPIIESNTKIAEDGGTRISKLVHHRFWEYGRIFLTNYFNHFNGQYLFLTGDSNLRHSTQEFGIFYHWEFITLLIGTAVLVTMKSKEKWLIIGWAGLAPVAGSLTLAAPHALRELFGLPVFTMISSLGLIQLIQLLKRYKVLLFTLYSLLIIDPLLFFHFYIAHYPKIYSSYWQYGYKQAINYLNDNKQKYDAVYLTNEYGRSYMYYLFYSRLNPVLAQQLILPYKDIPDIPQIGNIYFGKAPSIGGKILWIGSPPQAGSNKVIKEINFLNGQPAFKIWQSQ